MFRLVTRVGNVQRSPNTRRALKRTERYQRRMYNYYYCKQRQLGAHTDIHPWHINASTGKSPCGGKFVWAGRSKELILTFYTATLGTDWT